MKLYRNEVPQVSGSLLGGDVVIQFVRRGRLPADRAAPTPPAIPAQRPPRLRHDPDGADDAAAEPASRPRSRAEGRRQSSPATTSKARVAPNAFQVISNLEGDLSTADQLADAPPATRWASWPRNINKMLESNDDQINRIVNKTEQTLDSFQRALNNVDDVFGDEEVRDNLESPCCATCPSCSPTLATRSTRFAPRSSRSIATCETWRA